MRRILMIYKQVMSVLSAFKGRTAVAIIGVLLGAMALVIVQNISAALNAKVEEDIKIFGDRVFTVYARVPYVPGQMARRSRVTTMKMEDLNSILTMSHVIDAAPTVRRSSRARYGNSVINASIIGTTTDYFNMRGLTVENGRAFGLDERADKARVAVIGSEIAEELFGYDDPLEQDIYISNMPFRVIGVLEEKGSDPSGNNMDTIVIIPVETAMVRIMGRDYFNDIIVQIDSWDSYDSVTANLAQLLRTNHGLMSASQNNDFDIVNPIDEQEMVTTLLSVATTLGSGSAAIAFLIGGIGIFSLMLLIVNQRITEIGIKRAIGATKGDILTQFLLESGYIGIMGGFFGIFIGILLSLIISYFASLPYAISGFGVFIGFTASLLAGLIAGFYPAARASSVVPVKALRL